MARFTQSEWASLSRLLDEALELSPEQRATWIAEQRESHPELVTELEALLERESRIDEDGFLSAAHASVLPPMATLVGQTLGA
ncbi:MAG TPA: hypothetical protein VK636_21120 [Gemmatimonadaceae bacterium]|nr:hypothetical protein [Gemmatimonadaceae bacterium]